MTTLGEQDEAACAALMKDMPGARRAAKPVTVQNFEREQDEAACKARTDAGVGRPDGEIGFPLSDEQLALLDEIIVSKPKRPDADAILRAAQHAVVDRGQTHGDKRRVFTHAAKLWSADLGITITAEQVAWCMVLLKRARAANGEFNVDDYVDAAGYAGCAGELA